MRPQHLEVSAFGPFGGTVRVDFTDLAESGLFLIHGPTGAGKTTLLDALCFALYGKLPGRREAGLVRSHHAEPAAEPRAVLRFEAHGGRYRIDRTAAWEAPKQRGEGTTLRTAKAVLHRLDRGSEEVLGTGVTEVNREIERLIGLDVDQFQQVILLPQGRFEQLLRAGSADREKLFESLFDTARFKHVQEWLEKRAKEKRIRAADLRRDLETEGREILLRVGEIEGGAHPVALHEDAVEPDPCDPDVISAAAVRLDTAVRQLGERLDATEQDETDAHRALETLTALRTAVRNRDDLRTELERLEAAEAKLDEDRRRLARADAAEQLRAVLLEVDERTRLAREADQRIAAGLGRARQETSSLPIVVPHLTDLDLTELPGIRPLERAIGALRNRRSSLEDLRDTVRHIEKMHGERHAEARELERQGEVAHHARRRIESLVEEIPQRREACERSRHAHDQVGPLTDGLRLLQAKADAARRLSGLRPELVIRREEAVQARERANTAEGMHLTALRRRLEGMAAHLAGRLESGQPCTVCGSREHPDPAEPTTDAVGDDELERLEAASTEARQRAEELEGQLEQLVATVQEQTVAAGEFADDDEAARVAVEGATAQHAEAARLADALARLEKELESAEREKEATERVAAEADHAIVRIEQRIVDLERRLEDSRTRLAEALPEGVDLDAAVASLDALEPILTELVTSAEADVDLRSRLAAARERLAKQLDASDFTTPQEVRDALLEPIESERLRAVLSEAQQRRAVLRGRLAEPDLADLPETPPDIAPLEEAHRVAVAARKTAASAHGVAVAARDQLAGRIQNHRGLVDEVAAADEQATLLGGVADHCNGRGRNRVPLQRWVLATYLDEACRHANRRLAAMTSGRYRLRAVHERRDNRGSGGLELRIHDTNTNRERDVSTLSGGETFQASLALALGVADSVAAHAGGVRIDALFIDEGFGTLDPDALELAMDELDRLREGGRMVGVISHVTGLKERIGFGIGVQRTEAGSSVAVGPLA